MEKTARILFVGNSFTRIGDLPCVLTAMLNSGASGVRYAAETSLADAKGFQWHWEEGDAREKIAARLQALLDHIEILLFPCRLDIRRQFGRNSLDDDLYALKNTA